MQNVKQLLEEAGSCLDHVCKITVYITDRAYREPVYRTIGKWLKGVHPCSTGLIVNGLARPEWVMEIDVEAMIPAGEEHDRLVSGPEWMDAKQANAAGVTGGKKAKESGRASRRESVCKYGSRQGGPVSAKQTNTKE